MVGTAGQRRGAPAPQQPGQLAASWQRPEPSWCRQSQSGLGVSDAYRSLGVLMGEEVGRSDRGPQE
ncbi:hypothetical protein ABBQ38_007505 [Trebouxia sp. C0009 RCD-2024]